MHNPQLIPPLLLCVAVKALLFHRHVCWTAYSRTRGRRGDLQCDGGRRTEERGLGESPRCPSIHTMELSPFHSPSSSDSRALPRCTKSTKATLASHHSQSPITFFGGVASQQAMRCVVAGLTLAPATTKHSCALLSYSFPSSLAHGNKFRHPSALINSASQSEQPLHWVTILHLLSLLCRHPNIYSVHPAFIIVISLTCQGYSGSINLPGLISWRPKLQPRQILPCVSPPVSGLQ